MKVEIAALREEIEAKVLFMFQCFPMFNCLTTSPTCHMALCADRGWAGR